VLAKTTARHTSEEFVDFLAQIVESQPAKRQIHVIADNLSAHKTKKVFEFLAENPTVRIHYTPTYSSWLNQVEIWFSKIQRDVISRGVFTSLKDLAPFHPAVISVFERNCHGANLAHHRC
jgi:transposase